MSKINKVTGWQKVKALLVIIISNYLLNIVYAIVFGNNPI